MTGVLVSLLLAAAGAILGLPSGRSQYHRQARRRAVNHSGVREPPLILDLLGALLTAGASVEHAVSVVAMSCESSIDSSLQRVHAARLLGASWDAAWATGLDAPPPHSSPRLAERRGIRVGKDQERAVEEVRQGLRFATSTGAPSAALLHAHAAQLRRRHNREIDRKAAALGVQLVLPLGLCSLPAFICLGVVPVVLGLLPDL